jgi:hypothetical protein
MSCQPWPGLTFLKACAAHERTFDDEHRAAIPQPPGGSDSPGDLPGARPVSLDRLDVVIGQWEMEATFKAGFFGPGR